MALLARSTYDPATAASASTASLLAMTALDTANLRCVFVAPADGSVEVRLRGALGGSGSAPPRIMLGVLDGSTVKLRMVPMAAWVSGSGATTFCGEEVIGFVTGLTPGNTYTWDAAYSVDVVTASTNLKYGGPNDNAGADAWGPFVFEVWEATNLLAGGCYDPAARVTKSTTALLALTAFDTTNLRRTITAPASGEVAWRMQAFQHGATVVGLTMLGVLSGATVMDRLIPTICSPQNSIGASSGVSLSAFGTITGLTPGNSYNLDAAYAVQVVSTGGGIKYGGPDDTTTDNAAGGLAFDILSA